MGVMDDPLFESLLAAGLLWAVLVPVFAFLALRDRTRDLRQRLRLALTASGLTLLWLLAVGSTAGLALATGGREALAIGLMGLMFVTFGAAACLPSRVRATAASLLLRARRSDAGSRAPG